MKHTILVNKHVLTCDHDWAVEHHEINSLFELKVLLKHTIDEYGRDRVRLLREIDIQLEDLNNG